MIPLRDTQPSNSTPFVTLLLIAVNVFIFLYEVTLDPYSLNHLLAVYGIIPDRPEVRDLFTSMFLHGGWLHVIGNMWFLWIYGDNVEDILGHFKYLAFYLLCGVAAGAAHILVSPYSRVPTIGASGAIAGVMGAYMVKFPHSRIITLVPIIIFFTAIEVPAVLILVYWFVIQVFSGVWEVGYSQVSREGVAWFAHIGGFVAGMIMILLFPTEKRFRRRRDLQW